MDESLAQPDPIYKGCYLVENMEIFAGTQTKGRKIRSFCTHPEWSRQKIYGDAAILILVKPLVINNQVSAICLPEPNTIIGINKRTFCMISGFGKTEGTANDRVLNQQ